MGRTALLFGAGNGHSFICKLLIDKGADVNVKDNGFDALLCAARCGYSALCKLLIETGNTSLIFAATGDLVSVCELLISRGAIVEHQINGKTALNYKKEGPYRELLLRALAAADAQRQIEAEASEHKLPLEVTEEENRLAAAEREKEVDEKRQKFLLGKKAGIQRRTDVVFVEQRAVESRRRVVMAKAESKKLTEIAEADLKKLKEIANEDETKQNLMLKEAMVADEIERSRLTEDSNELKKMERASEECLCFICYENPVVMFLIPCCHKAYCLSCWALPETKSLIKCPFCREVVTSVHQHLYK